MQSNIIIKRNLLTYNDKGITKYNQYVNDVYKALNESRLNFYINPTKSKLRKIKKELSTEDIAQALQRRKGILNYTELERFKRTNKILTEKFSYNEFVAAEQIRHNRQVQRKNIIQQISYWILKGYEITFSTYTLNDDTLYRYADSNLENTKKLQDKLTRILNDKTIDYIGNVDYGKNKNRLHYHVLECRKPELKEYQEHIFTATNIEWQKYGFSNTQYVKYSDKDITKVSSYLSKLSSHSIKVKTTRLFKKKNSDYKKLKKHFDLYKIPITPENIIDYIEHIELLEVKKEWIQRYEQIKLL